MGPAFGALALALQALNRHDDAAVAFRRGLTLHPENATMRAGFAQTLRSMGRLQEAESQARLAVHLAPASPLGHLALGAALAEQGDIDAATTAFKAGTALPPDSPEASVAAGMVRLLLCDYPAGWEGFQARAGAGPAWPLAANLRGALINVHPEQGLGDTLFFARCLPMLAARGAIIGFAAPPPLHRLLQALPGVAEGQIRLEAHARATLRCNLPDLGHLLALRPSPAPALPPPSPQAWSTRLPRDGRLRVGLAWSGNPDFANDRARSIPLPALAPLLALPNCHFIAIQTDNLDAARAAGIETFPLADFADTASLIANLDLVISADTAPAHLAGVLHAPLRILLPAMPDWRWGLGREDCPWYPSARLTRQSRAGDWSPVIDRLTHELRTLPYRPATRSCRSQS